MATPSDPRPPLAGRPTRVAVVGAGFIAEFHLDILEATPDVEVVCVCDVDAERAAACARRRGVEHSTTDLGELARLGVDVAHLLVPPTLHARLTRELLEHGVGVFVEKPLALTSAEARELTALAQERGLPLGVNHNAIFFPSFARLLERVREGEIGRVEHVQVTLSVPLRQLDAGDFSHWMFREPRNIVFEQAPHPAAQLVELVGKVRSCSTTLLGTRELFPGHPFHERWLAAARAEGGTAEIYLAFGQPFTRSTVQVLGSDGSLQADVFHDHLEGERKTLWLDFWNSFLAGWRRGGMLRRSALAVTLGWFGQTLGLTRRRDGFFAGMRGSIQGFHAALRAGQPLPADGEKGARVLEWCEAIAREVPALDAPAPELPEAGPPRPGEVCVLGGTGFIGKRVVARLLERDVPVTCIVRRAHSLPPLLTEAARDGRVRLVRGALDDPDSLRAAFAGCRAVLHLATGNGDTWEAVERVMVRGTEAAARAAGEAGVGRFVFVSSTAALYAGKDAGEELADSPEGDPQAEERALYARGKAATERALFALHAQGVVKVAVARPGIVLGPGTPMQHSGLGLWVRDNHCVGWGAGTNPLPIVLADDVAEALVLAALHEGEGLDGKAFNLASAAPLDARTVVAEMRRASGRALHFHPRPLALSQAMEIGKWLVKKAGRRRDAVFPSWRDLKSRQLYPRLECDVARGVLGWKPVDEPSELLRRALAGLG